jgi:hypothetical protein
MIKIMSDLTKSIRQVQLQIDETPKNEYEELNKSTKKIICVL